MQGQVEQRALAIYADLGKSGGRLTARALGRILGLTGRAILRNTSGRDLSGNVIAQGEMSVKNMMRKNGAFGVDTQEVATEDLKVFRSCARKYGIEYAIHRNKGDPDKVVIYMREKNKGSMLELFSEYSKRVLQKEQRPSIRKQIKLWKDKAQEHSRARAAERGAKRVERDVSRLR